MDIDALGTPLAAFAAGLVTSVHCSAMCGPLGCALLWSRDAAPSSIRLVLATYHGSRLLSYTLIGSVLGVLGLSGASLFDSAPARFLPWVLAGIFLFLGLGLDRRLPPPRFLSSLLFRINFKPGRSRMRPALLLGLATPFLPCGPLYLAFAAALFAGSFTGGGVLMASFALGTLPLYWLLQMQLLRLSPAWLQRGRRAFALLSSGLLAWRAAAITGTGSALLDGILCH